MGVLESAAPAALISSANSAMIFRPKATGVGIISYPTVFAPVFAEISHKTLARPALGLRIGLVPTVWGCNPVYG